MDFTPPTSPNVSTNIKWSITKQTPISPVTPKLKIFPSLKESTSETVFGQSHLGASERSYDHLIRDFDLYNVNPTQPTFGNTMDMISYLKEWSGSDILHHIITDSMDFLQDPDLKLKSNNLIGQGSYCYIYEVDTHTDQKIVLKFPQSKRKSKTILNEAVILTYLHLNDIEYGNNYIIPFYGITYISKSHFKRLRSNDYMPGLLLTKFNLNLQQFIKFLKQNYPDDLTLKKSMWKKLYDELMIALNYLKYKHVVHSDIKTANIMIGSETSNDNLLSFENLDFYLCDFTSSIIQLPNNESYQTYVAGGIVSSQNLNLNTTLEYCPPEVIQKIINKDGSNNSDENATNFSYDTDLYSFALCLLSFICEDEPFNELKNFKFHQGMDDPSNSYSNNSKNIASSIQHTQWLINSILKNDPIGLNTFNDRGNDYYRTNWSEELSLISKILVDRISLEECISLT